MSEIPNLVLKCIFNSVSEGNESGQELKDGLNFTEMMEAMIKEW